MSSKTKIFLITIYLEYGKVNRCYVLADSADEAKQLAVKTYGFEAFEIVRVQADLAGKEEVLRDYVINYI